MPSTTTARGNGGRTVSSRQADTEVSSAVEQTMLGTGCPADWACPEDADLSRWREDVIETIRQNLLGTSLASISDHLMGAVASGKMIRSRIAGRLQRAVGLPRAYLLGMSASVEMLHSASLLHDDVVDGARLRRGAPAFWTQKGTSGALLLGDLLMCRAMSLAAEWGSLDLTRALIRLLEAVCDSEAEHELILRGERLSWDKCVDIARRKTGSLFAYITAACGRSDTKLREALHRAGLDVGTAYQLADDVYDAYGDTLTSGKPLRNDSAAGKVTVAALWAEAGMDPRDRIEELCWGSSDYLADWPLVQQAWAVFVERDLRPALNCFLGSCPGAAPAPQHAYAASGSSGAAHRQDGVPDQ